MFGSSVALMGDADGDGVFDVVVGAPGDDVVGTDVGAIYILLLSSTGTLKSVPPPSAAYIKITQNTNFATCTTSSACLTNNDAFGSSVAGIGDVDRNGYADIAVASKSSVFIIYMHLDATAKMPKVLSFTKLDVSPYIGLNVPSSLAGLGDLDGNGILDLAIGYDGAADGEVTLLFLSQTGCSFKIVSVSITAAGTGYANGGALSADCTGIAGCTGTGFAGTCATDVGTGAVTSISISDYGSGYSSSAPPLITCAGAGGVNLAVTPTLVDNTNEQDAASICISGSPVEIKNGVGGFTEACVGAGCKFGSSISLIGDVDGDSVPDLVVGAKADDCGGTDRGAAYLLMLNSGTWTVRTSVKLCKGANGISSSDIPNDNAQFGSSVAAAGDINGDGIPDLIVGAPKDYVNGGTIKGAIYWFALSRTGTVVATKKFGGEDDLQTSQTVSGLGMSLTAVNDLNRDGMGDVISGVGLDAANEGAITAFLLTSWSKWKSGGNPVGGTPTSSTGPSSASDGSSFYYHATGIVCNDGTMFKNFAGNTLNGEYSYIYEGNVETFKISSIAIVAAGTGYTNGGSATATAATGSGFSGTCTADGIASVTVTAAGTGYTSGAFTVTCNAPCTGTGLAGTCAVDGGGAVTGITVSDVGSGYSAGNLPTISCATGNGGTFTAVAGAVTSVTIISGGSGYLSASVPTITCAGGLGGTFTASLADNTDEACAERCAADELCNFYTSGAAYSCKTYRTCWRQDSIADTTATTYRKASYIFVEGDTLGTNAAPGTALFVAPPGQYDSVSFWYHMYGVNTGTLSLDVKSLSVPINSGVVGAVTFEIESLTINTAGVGIASITVTAAGTGYTNDGAATCTANCAGSGFVATCQSTGGVVSGITILNPGSGYSSSSLPTIECAGGAGGAFTPTMTTTAAGYQHEGSAWADCTYISGCTGSGFAGTCIADGVSSISITAGGSGYTDGAAASASCTGIANCVGKGFAGTCAVTGGAVTGITITNPGSGFSAIALPSIICAGGSNLVAAATLGAVTAIVVTSGGSGYLSSAPPEIKCEGGTNLAATPTFLSNSVTLETTAPAQFGAYAGKLIKIGSETRTISEYTYGRVVTVSLAFGTAPTASSSMYTIYEQKTRETSSSKHANDWASVWSLSGQQQLSSGERWIKVTVGFSAIARPIEFRFAATRGSAGAACDIALDRIHVYRYNTPTSQLIGLSKTTKLQVIPSYRLYMGFHTVNSPFAITVRSALSSSTKSICEDCTSQNQISAAVATTYVVTFKDAFNNVRVYTDATEGGVTVGRPGQMYASNHEDGLVVFLESATNPNERLIASSSFSSGATYNSGLTPEGLDETASTRTFASSDLKIKISKVGGLNATYHRVPDLAFPVFERVDNTVDFSFTQSVPGAPAMLPPDYFSVRWKGFVRPPSSETWTFKTVTSSSSGATGKEGVRLWLSGTGVGELALVIDRWDGLEPEYTGTLSMLAEKLYEIQMEYKDTFSTSKVQLMWMSASSGYTSFTIVPSDRLYYDAAHLTPTSPMTVTVTA